MKLYQLNFKQVLPITQQEAWDFLSSPKNLKKITPEHMGFNILTEDEGDMYAGQIIQYDVSPFPGFSTRWVTEITQVRQGEYFIDEQRFGPYALWHHKHFIKPLNEGVLMEDVIDYKLPLGILGQLGHAIFVKKQLQQIFKYREQKLTELFGKVDSFSNELVIKTI